MLVPTAVQSFSALLELLETDGWTGLILCLYSPTDAHYVAFCQAETGWYFFDPDGGVVAPQPATRAPLLPDGIFSPLLSRALFRFKHGGRFASPTAATVAVRTCLGERLAQVLEDEDMN